MKTMLRKVVLLLVLLTMAAGSLCTVATYSDEEAVVTIGTTGRVETSLDPAEAYDLFGWEIILNTGSCLVDIRPGSKAGPEDFLPALATDWSVSADGLTWTFNLRRGVKFEDGTEFTADDVKYSFDRSMGLAIPDGPQVSLGYSDIIESIEVSDTYQVKFHLRFPFAPFLSLMACQASAIVNPKYAPIDRTVGYTEGDARASSPLDLGPYTLTKWSRIDGEDYEMRLDANPNYWNATGGYPKTKHIVIKFYKNPTDLFLAIAAGEIDVAHRHLRPTDVLDLAKNPNLKVWWGMSGFIQYMIFQEAISPFNDVRVRKALAAALDRPALCEQVFHGTASPLYSIIPLGLMGHTEAFKQLVDLALLNFDEENHVLNINLSFLPRLVSV